MSLTIALLAPANVGHTVQWANLLTAHGCKVHVISLHRYDTAAGVLNKQVQVHYLTPKAPLGYVLATLALAKLLRKLQPQVLNAHFATGYGTLARLARQFTRGRVMSIPYMLSVWGTDVYEFPMKSALHRWWLKGNLQAADAIGSTSHAMERQTRTTFSHPHIFVTPFGIDTERFTPSSLAKTALENTLTVGTVKTLHHRYGIDRLLKVFAACRREVGDDLSHRLRLRIVGAGPQATELKHLAESLGIAQVTEFVGKVAHDEVPGELNKLDVYVALSRYESFGVAILEANSCGVTTLVSDADGPAEVVVHGHTGLIAQSDKEAKDYLQTLLLDTELRLRLAENGRQHVLENYSQQVCVAAMLRALERTLEIERCNPEEP